MIDDFKLTKHLIRFEDKFDNWEDAVRASSSSLLEGEYITKSYVDAMIESVKKYGPYIIIAPNIAMPHARPEAGALKVGFSVMLVKEPVKFSTEIEDQAQIFVALSCVNADTHLLMMQALIEVIGDEEIVEKILKSTTKEEILALFN